MPSNRKLRIALECRMEDHRSGVGSAILALAHALSQSAIADQEYTFIVYADTKSWLEPHIFGPCRIVGMERPRSSRLRQMLSKISPIRKLWKTFRTRLYTLPESDGYVESERFDLVHFVTPVGYSTARPTIYQPHDLQHLHYPDFFPKDEFDHREKSYRALCRQALCICVQTEWCKQDVAEKFETDPDKIAIVKWGCVHEAYQAPTSDEIDAIVRKLALPSQYFIYPAVTWPHKNHELILRALRRLKTDQRRVVQVYFTGKSTEHRPYLEKIASQLEVADQVHYLGFVTSTELQVLLRNATAMVFPSKFEGFGLPIFEAYRACLPVVCSSSSSLPEVAQDAALYFDPESPEQLASKMLLMLDDVEVREQCIRRGEAVLGRSSFKQTASEFQLLYRKIMDAYERKQHPGPDRRHTGVPAMVQAE